MSQKHLKGEKQRAEIDNRRREGGDEGGVGPRVRWNRLAHTNFSPKSRRRRRPISRLDSLSPTHVPHHRKKFLETGNNRNECITIMMTVSAPLEPSL